MLARDGSPVTVACERVDEFVYLRALGLPGLSMDEKEMKAAIADLKVGSLEDIAKSMAPVIEAGTAFIKADGTRIAPAFSWDPAKCPPSIPGRYLSTESKSVLSATILRLSGFVSGAAEALSFPVRERAGGGEGAGAGEVRQDVRADTDTRADGSAAG